MLDRLLTRSNQLLVFGLVVLVVWVIATVRLGVLILDESATDYTSFWAAGEMVARGQGAEVYDLRAHHLVTEELTGPRTVGFAPYLLPPSFLAVAWALALAPVEVGFVMLGLGGVAGSAWVLRRINPDRLVVVLGLASPTTLASIEIGQLGLIMGTAAATALLDAHHRPWRAAVALAVLSLKPQFGIGVGVGLVAVGAWRALGRGLALSIAAVVASGALFGPSLWAGFAELVAETNQLMAQFRAQNPFYNQGVASLLEAAGAGPTVAWAAQAVVSVVVLGLVVVHLRRFGLTPRGMALVLVATVVISPRSFGYDHQVLVPAAALLITHPHRRPAAGYLVVALAAALVGAAVFGHPTGPAASLLLLWLAAPLAPDPADPATSPGPGHRPTSAAVTGP